MVVLGLTGSIAMGKTTTAAMFAEQGAALYDADAAVHALYQAGGGAGERLRPLFPDAVTAEGAVRRDTLKALLADDPARLAILEAEVFPLMALKRQTFLSGARTEGRRLAVLDIPLLYETGAERLVDAVVVVTADPAVQRTRAFSRNGMDEATFTLLASRQLPDSEKRRRADFLVFTDRGLEAAQRDVQRITAVVLAPGWTRKAGPDKPTVLSNIGSSTAGGLG